MLRILSKKDTKQVSDAKQVLLEEAIEQFKEETCRTCEEITSFEYTQSGIKGQPFWMIRKYLVDRYNCMTCGEQKEYYTPLQSNGEGLWKISAPKAKKAGTSALIFQSEYYKQKPF